LTAAVDALHTRWPIPFGVHSRWSGRGRGSPAAHRWSRAGNIAHRVVTPGYPQPWVQSSGLAPELSAHVASIAAWTRCSSVVQRWRVDCSTAAPRGGTIAQSFPTSTSRSLSRRRSGGRHSARGYGLVVMAWSPAGAAAAMHGALWVKRGNAHRNDLAKRPAAARNCCPQWTDRHGRDHPNGRHIGDHTRADRVWHRKALAARSCCPAPRLTDSCHQRDNCGSLAARGEVPKGTGIAPCTDCTCTDGRGGAVAERKPGFISSFSTAGCQFRERRFG